MTSGLLTEWNYSGRMGRDAELKVVLALHIFVKVSHALNVTCYPCRCVISWMQTREQQLPACQSAAEQTASFAQAPGRLGSRSHATPRLESIWSARVVELLPYWMTQARHRSTSEWLAARPVTERLSFLPILASPVHTTFILIISIVFLTNNEINQKEFTQITCICTHTYIHTSMTGPMLLPQT